MSLGSNDGTLEGRSTLVKIMTVFLTATIGQEQTLSPNKEAPFGRRRRVSGEGGVKRWIGLKEPESFHVPAMLTGSVPYSSKLGRHGHYPMASRNIGKARSIISMLAVRLIRKWRRRSKRVPGKTNTDRAARISIKRSASPPGASPHR